MAIQDQLISQGSSWLTGIVLTFGVALGIILIVAGVYFGLRYKRYKQFKIVFFEKDGFGHWQYRLDSAGIFVDSKTNNKRLFLEKNKVGLEPDNIPYVTDAKGNKTIFLLRLGLKNFRFLRLNFNEPSPLFEVGEEDVNWAINSYERAKKRFSETMLMQILPYIALAIVSMAIMVIFIYLFKKLDVLKDMAIAFQQASTVLAQSQTGTVVLP